VGRGLGTIWNHYEVPWAGNRVGGGGVATLVLKGEVGSNIGNLEADEQDSSDQWACSWHALLFPPPSIGQTHTEGGRSCVQFMWVHLAGTEQGGEGGVNQRHTTQCQRVKRDFLVPPLPPGARQLTLVDCSQSARLFNTQNC
jgi:hypothetical protein